MSTRKLAYSALLCAAAIVFGYIESLLPLPVSVPGIKLGISNLVLLFVLVQDRKIAWGIMLVKVVLTSVLFSGMTAFFYALAGGVLSMLVMTLLYSTKKFSIVAISMAGGVFHNLGQLCAAALILTTIKAAYWLPFLVFAGAAAGTVLGVVCRILLSRIPWRI